MKPKCLIFDCDGVLVDSLPLSNRVMLELIAPYGISKEFEKVIHHYNGGSLWASLKKIEELMGEKLPEDFVARYRELTYSTFKEELRPIEGAKELLEKSGLPKCVASSGPYEKIEQNLRTTGLLKYFGENIFSSYEIKSWKPEPDIFLHAAAKMGFRPKECVVIEDSLDGIAAAVKGGFDCLGLASEVNFSEMANSPAVVFRSMAEIEDFLR